MHYTMLDVERSQRDMRGGGGVVGGVEAGNSGDRLICAGLWALVSALRIRTFTFEEMDRATTTG